MGEQERAWNYTTGRYAMLHRDRLEEAIRFLDPLIEAVRRRGAVFNFSSLSAGAIIMAAGRWVRRRRRADGVRRPAAPQRVVRGRTRMPGSPRS